MVGSRLNVLLYRDSFNTPWGFRLQGGKDLNQPLVVQRVFSNSPAEGELQRGDVILSINNRDGTSLTHKQAQDCIKHGGGQVELIVNRPPPGTQVSPLSPPIVTPRAPTLKLQMPMYASHPNPQNMSGVPDHHSQPQKPPTVPHHQPLHVQAAPPDRHRSSFSQPPGPTTPTTPTIPPPWAVQQAPPKNVCKLSQLGGGGGYSFAVDYATLPRRRSSSMAQQHQAPRRTADTDDMQNGYQEADHLATGPMPKGFSKASLGGGGYNMGQTYGGSSTLPRRNTGAPSAQPPMPASHGGIGHMPTRVPISKLGGGGPSFGSDFSHVQVQPRYEPAYTSLPPVQTAAQRYEPAHMGQKMLHRVQGTLENIALSPRTPEANPTPPWQQYEQQPQYMSQAPAPMAPQYQPPQAPQYQAPQAPQYQAPAEMFTPTSILLEQQQQQQQQQQHYHQEQQNHEVRIASDKPIPRVLKPTQGQPATGDFGVDYNRKQFTVKPAPVNVARPLYCAPAPAQQYTLPVNAPAPAPVHHIPVQTSTQSWQKPPQVVDDNGPAWGNTLRSTGVKPWEMDLYNEQQEAPRSVPYNPIPAQNYAVPAPATAPTSDAQEGPKVVHLQYNSPMHLYSNENVQETLRGQTQVIVDQTKVKNDKGERDWTQSQVLQLIEQDNRRGPKAAPITAPKPQIHQVQLQQQQPTYDEIGASDF